MDKKIVLSAVVGSQAYGLATKNSDVDMMGVFVEPTSVILGIHKYQETIASTAPDSAYHEVGKFIRLAMKCNPTILELLFMPEYVVLSDIGAELVRNRKIFLSKIAFKSYGGYALDQAKKLNRRGDSFSAKTKHRYDKNARHCFRLFQQGRQLLETGNMDIRVDNREELFAIGKLPVQELVAKFKSEYAEFEKIKSVLPEEPDYKKINELLLWIRRKTW